MKTHQIFKQLLNEEPNAGRYLHNAFGIDFYKPFNMYYLKGNYTINKIYNIIHNDTKTETLGGTIILLTKNPDSYNKDLHIVTIKNGNINIEHKVYKHTGNIKKRVNIDYYFRKSDFETTRKNNTTETFIIYQQKEYRTEQKENKINYNERYKTIDKCSCKMGDGRGNTWLYRLFLKSLENNTPEFEYEIDYYNFKTNNINEIIDKSGYLLCQHRADLKRKAQTLKAERQKAEYNKTDNTEKIKELETIIKETKNDIIKCLSESNNHKTTSKIGRLIYFDFSYIEQDFEIFKDKTINKKFESIEKSDNCFNSIKNKIDEINKKMKEEQQQ